MPDPFVKHLRRNQTPAESRLWFQLRCKRIAGRAFRRQHRLDRYVVDFVCLSARLVIEVDGPSHDQTAGEDALRTRRLESQGYRILRFPNAQVLSDLDSVVRTIEAVLLGHISVEPPETIPPPPVGGGKGAGSARGARPRLFAPTGANPLPQPPPTRGGGIF